MFHNTPENTATDQYPFYNDTESVLPASGVTRQGVMLRALKIFPDSNSHFCCYKNIDHKKLSKLTPVNKVAK